MSSTQSDNPSAVSPDVVKPVRTPRGVKCRRWRCAATLLAVFVCGVVVGSAATVYVINERFYLRSKEPASIPERLTRRLRREIDLTDPQAQQVQDILTRRMMQIMEIREQVRPQMEAQFQAVRHEVAQVLAGDQVQRWEQWFDDFRERRRKRWKSLAPPSSQQQPGVSGKPAP